MGIVFPWGVCVAIAVYQVECRPDHVKEAERRGSDAEKIRQLHREAEAEAARRAREPIGPE